MKNLKFLRQQKKLSQQKLADYLQLSQQSVYKYENGLAEPDLDTLIRMADFFDTSVDYLIGYSSYERKVQPYTESYLSDVELEHMSAYRTLPKRMRSIVDTLMTEYNQKKN